MALYLAPRALVRDRRPQAGCVGQSGRAGAVAVAGAGSWRVGAAGKKR